MAQVLIDGCFNADPHPGNILCADGKLALIDYGQVKRLTTKQRLDLAKAFLLVEAAIQAHATTLHTGTGTNNPHSPTGLTCLAA